MKRFIERIKFFRTRRNKKGETGQYPYDSLFDKRPILYVDSEVRHLGEAFTQAILGILIIVLAGLGAVVILSDPNNPAQLIASILGQICKQTGQCSFYILLPSFAIANVILLSILIFFIFLMSWAWGTKPASQGDMEELRDYIAKVANSEALTEALDDIQWKIKTLARMQGYNLEAKEDDHEEDVGRPDQSKNA